MRRDVIPPPWNKFIVDNLYGRKRGPGARFIFYKLVKIGTIIARCFFAQRVHPRMFAVPECYM